MSDRDNDQYTNHDLPVREDTPMTDKWTRADLPDQTWVAPETCRPHDVYVGLVRTATGLHERILRRSGPRPNCWEYWGSPEEGGMNLVGDDAVSELVMIGPSLPRQLRRAERERDAAVARAEAAEKRHTWPKTTPTGHTYTEPDTYEALCHEHDNAAQAAIESWEEDECPPEPTWEMVGIAHRDRDEWKARARAEADNRYSGTLNHAFVEGALWATHHVEPKDRHVDQ